MAKINRLIITQLTLYFESKIAASKSDPFLLGQKHLILYIMRGKLFKHLSEPAPTNDRPWIYVALSVAIVIFILAVFEPFNFRLNSLRQLWVLLGFALVALLATSIVFVLFPKIFKQFYNPQKWSVGKSLLNNIFLLLIVGVCVVCYDYFIVIKQLPGYFPTSFLIDLFAALTIGIAPITIITIIIQNRALKRNLCESKEITKELSKRVKSDTTENRYITLKGSTKESINVKAEELLFIEATGNYVAVHYKQNGRPTQKLLRSTIKQMEDSLQNHAIFIRCHRAFIVNINIISNINGNAQGHKLTLLDSLQEIPVSRTYLKKLKEALR